MSREIEAFARGFGPTKRVLDTIASNKEVQPQPAPPGCGFSTSATPNAFGAVSPEDVLRGVGPLRPLQ
jgi:pantoate kinase